MKRRRMSPEEEAAYREFRRQSAENLKKLREIVARGWEKLEAQRAQEERRASS
jgi:hypothetical protein